MIDAEQKWREAQARMKAMEDEEKSGVTRPSRKPSGKKYIKSMEAIKEENDKHNNDDDEDEEDDDDYEDES